jgi:hypothetical protein
MYPNFGAKRWGTDVYGMKLMAKTPQLLKCLYFADTTERGDRGVKGGPKTG